MKPRASKILRRMFISFLIALLSFSTLPTALAQEPSAPDEEALIAIMSPTAAEPFLLPEGVEQIPVVFALDETLVQMAALDIILIKEGEEVHTTQAIVYPLPALLYTFIMNVPPLAAGFYDLEVIADISTIDAGEELEGIRRLMERQAIIVEPEMPPVVDDEPEPVRPPWQWSGQLNLDWDILPWDQMALDFRSGTYRAIRVDGPNRSTLTINHTLSNASVSYIDRSREHETRVSLRGNLEGISHVSLRYRKDPQTWLVGHFTPSLASMRPALTSLHLNGRPMFGSTFTYEVEQYRAFLAAGQQRATPRSLGYDSTFVMGDFTFTPVEGLGAGAYVLQVVPRLEDGPAGTALGIHGEYAITDSITAIYEHGLSSTEESGFFDGQAQTLSVRYREGSNSVTVDLYRVAEDFFLYGSSRRTPGEQGIEIAVIQDLGILGRGRLTFKNFSRPVFTSAGRIDQSVRETVVGTSARFANARVSAQYTNRLTEDVAEAYTEERIAHIFRTAGSMDIGIITYSGNLQHTISRAERFAEGDSRSSESRLTRWNVQAATYIEPWEPAAGISGTDRTAINTAGDVTRTSTYTPWVGVGWSDAEQLWYIFADLAFPISLEDGSVSERWIDFGTSVTRQLRENDTLELNYSAELYEGELYHTLSVAYRFVF